MEERKNKEEKNKKLIICLIGVFVVACVFCLLYFNNNKEKYVYSNNDNFKEFSYNIKLSDYIYEITYLDSRIKAAKFVNDQKEDKTEKNNHTIKIVDNIINVQTKNALIKINSIKNPVSVSFVSNYPYAENNGYAYVLNSEGELFRVYYDTAQGKNAAHDTMISYIDKYELPKIESYSVNVESLNGDKDIDFYVVAKTNDGKYYTDYFFVARNSEDNRLNEIKDVSVSNRSSYEVINSYKGLLDAGGGYNYDVKCSENDKTTFHAMTSKVECFNSDDRYIFYKDNLELRIYDTKKNNYYVVNTNNTSSEGYNLVATDEKLIGMTYNDKNNETFFSFTSAQEMYKDKYTFGDVLNINYIAANDENNAYILSLNNEKIVLSTKSNDYQYTYMLYGDNYISLVATDGDMKKIYNSNLQLIIDDFANISDVDINSSNNLIIVKNNKSIITYDKNGKIINTNNKYSKVLSISEDYVIYLDSNKVKYSKNDKDLGTVIELDNSDEVLNAYKSENEIYVSVKNNKVTVTDVWNACEKNDLCNQITKEDIKKYNLGYTYTYNVDTKKIEKYADIVDDVTGFN